MDNFNYTIPELKHDLKVWGTFTSEEMIDRKSTVEFIGIFERKLAEKAIRLLQCRAGGRYTMFEAGLLYQTCLLLGLKDSRPGKIGEQELSWEKLVGSCSSEAEAKTALLKILS